MLKRHLTRTRVVLTCVMFSGLVMAVALFPVAVFQAPGIQWHLFWPMVSIGPLCETHSRLHSLVVAALGEVSDSAVAISISKPERFRLGAGARWLASIYGLKISGDETYLSLRMLN